MLVGGGQEVDICNLPEHGAWPALFPQFRGSHCMGMGEPRNPLDADVPGFLCLPVLCPTPQPNFPGLRGSHPCLQESLLKRLFVDSVCQAVEGAWEFPQELSPVTSVPRCLRHPQLSRAYHSTPVMFSLLRFSLVCV